MHQNKKIMRICAFAVCIGFVLPFTLTSCKKDKDKNEEETETSIVNVTDENGENVTEIIKTTNKSGETVTKIVEATEVVAIGNGTTSVISGSTSKSSKTTAKTTAKTTVKTTAKVTAAPTTTKAAVYAAPVILTNSASGTVAYSNEKAIIDASHTSDGYVMVKYLGSNSKVKVLIKKSTQYQYNITNTGSYVALPLSEGSGTYTIGVYENTSGTSYSTALSQSISVTLSSQFSPFLRPNQYVDYNGGTSVVLKAANLCTGCSTQLDKVSAIYNWVINYFSYDYDKASSVASGYIPNLNAIYSSRKGICLDYAAEMTAMLRSQGIPTKLVVGYAKSGSSTVYHSWISTYINGSGWINGIIYFDGTSWKLMDPTFASTGNSSSSTMNYINNTSNYSARYCY